MPNNALPEHLRGTKHWDYPKFLKWVPRAWTSFNWGKPALLAGNQKEQRAGGPAPVGERGSWQVSRFPGAPGILRYFPLYFSFTLKNGRHFRIGARYDDVDDYTTFPTAASRKYTGEAIEDTSTR